jgi:diguanylate cyclase (GGDEF)-like protein
VFILGVLLFVGLYHIAIYLLRKKEPAPLFFALFCLFIFIRQALSGTKLLIVFFPSVSWVALLNITHIVSCLAVPMSVHFLSELFPKYKSRIMLKMIYSMVIAFCLFIAAAPVKIFMKVLFIFNFFIFPAAVIYVLYILFRTAINRDRGAKILITGFLILIVTAIHDILYQHHIIQSIDLLAVGVFAFTFLQAYVLASRFTSAFHHIEKLTDELEDINANLESRVQQQTQELRDANKQLRGITFQDPLTGLKNRRYLNEVVYNLSETFLKHKTDKEVQKRNLNLDNMGIGICLIDIDHFKNINDTYGHEAGDIVLKKIAHIFKQIVRFDDIVVRWGGEEFLFILKRMDIHFLPDFLKKINKAVAETPFRISQNKEIMITISIGSVAFPFFDKEPKKIRFEECINLSDLCLLHAKRTGRNRVVYMTPGLKLVEYTILKEYLTSLSDGSELKTAYAHVHIYK